MSRIDPEAAVEARFIGFDPREAERRADVGLTEQISLLTAAAGAAVSPRRLPLQRSPIGRIVVNPIGRTSHRVAIPTLGRELAEPQPIVFVDELLEVIVGFLGCVVEVQKPSGLLVPVTAQPLDLVNEVLVVRGRLFLTKVICKDKGCHFSSSSFVETEERGHTRRVLD
jgi:hypothetical protein